MAVNAMMAIILAAVTVNLSAGLALFIAVSSLFGVVQTFIQRAWVR